DCWWRCAPAVRLPQSRPRTIKNRISRNGLQVTDNSLDRNGFFSDVLTDIPPDEPSRRRDDSASRKPMPFIDLAQQRRRLADRIDRAIQRVLDHGHYIMGPEVRRLEENLSEFCGAKHALTCSNGTDALGLILMALEVGPGDAVLCPSFTFAATAEAIAWFGATPVFVDILPDSFNMDVASLEAAIRTAKARDLTPVGVVSVDLFGQPADFGRIEPVCNAHGLWLLSDAAQSFGAAYKGRKVGTIGVATATSFYPAKPLGCYGDGGAV